jgi:energy-coupling factor transporter transmembrane protein EcfT
LGAYGVNKKTHLFLSFLFFCFFVSSPPAIFFCSIYVCLFLYAFFLCSTSLRILEAYNAKNFRITLLFTSRFYWFLFSCSDMKIEEPGEDATAHVHLGLHVIDFTIMETSLIQISMQFINSYWTLRLAVGYIFCNFAGKLPPLHAFSPI